MYEEDGGQGGGASGATCVSGVGWPELASARGEFWRVGVFGLSSAAWCGHDREFFSLSFVFRHLISYIIG